MSWRLAGLMLGLMLGPLIALNVQLYIPSPYDIIVWGPACFGAGVAISWVFRE